MLRGRGDDSKFLFVAYGLSFALSLLIGLTGGYRSRWIGLGYLSMLIPTIAVVVTYAVANDKRRPTGWERCPWRYIPVALFLMPFVMHAAMLPAAIFLDRVQWQDWLTPATDGLYHSPTSRGWGVLTTQGLVFRMAINAIAGVMIVALLALFEEIGWRGWLIPQLIQSMNKRRAVVVSSLIWACWHIPFALAGIQHLDGVPPGLTALVTPVGIFGSGLVIGWLWLRTESLWIVVIAHGALNHWGQYAFKFMAGTGRPADVLVLGSGALALIAMGVILLYPRALGWTSEL